MNLEEFNGCMRNYAEYYGLLVLNHSLVCFSEMQGFTTTLESSKEDMLLAVIDLSLKKQSNPNVACIIMIIMIIMMIMIIMTCPGCGMSV